MNPIYVLAGCAAVAGSMVAGVFAWQEASGVGHHPCNYKPVRGP